MPERAPVAKFPVPVADRYWSVQPESDTGASVGFSSSTNLFVKGWFALPPFR